MVIICDTVSRYRIVLFLVVAGVAAISSEQDGVRSMQEPCEARKPDCSSEAPDLDEGNNDCCTEEEPCQVGEGDCDADSHCAGDLVCGNANCDWEDVSSSPDDCCHENDAVQNTKLEIIAWVMLMLMLLMVGAITCVSLKNRRVLQSSFAEGLQTICKAYQCKRGLHDEDIGAILHRASQHRVRHASSAFRLLLCCFIVATFFRAWILFGLLTSQADSARDIRFGLVGDFENLCWTSFCGYFVMRPRCTTPRKLDTIQVGLAAFFIWQNNQITIDANYDFFQTWVILNRCLWAVVLGNAPLSMFLQAVFVVSDIILYPEAFRFWSPQYAQRQTTVALCVSALCWALELSRLAQARASLEGQQATNAYRQVSRVLTSMCDAVVTLDESLCISGGPENGMQKLCSLLMMDSSAVRRPFIDFVIAQDKERWNSHMIEEVEQLRRGDPSGMQTATFHLSLRSQYGLPVPVQVFSSALSTQDQPIYFFGIRADTDVECLAASRQQEAAASPPMSRSIPEASVIGSYAAFSVDEVRAHNRRHGASDDGSMRAGTSRRSGSSSSSGQARSPGGTIRRSSAGNQGSIASMNRRRPGGDRLAQSKLSRGLKFTQQRTFVYLLDEVAQRVCFDDSKVVRCCPWHSGLFGLLHPLNSAMQKPCKPSFAILDGKQCAQCGLLADANDEECWFCGSLDDLLVLNQEQTNQEHPDDVQVEIDRRVGESSSGTRGANRGNEAGDGCADGHGCSGDVGMSGASVSQNMCRNSQRVKL